MKAINTISDFNRVFTEGVTGLYLKANTLHIREIAAMNESELNDWQILESANINPVRISGRDISPGSIELGKVDDLLLLNANPVEDLITLSDISKVFKNGKEINRNSPDLDSKTLVRRQRECMLNVPKIHVSISSPA